MSQAEQRANARPEDPNRIYQFDVIDKWNAIVVLSGNRGKTIKNNLASHDLFSFANNGELSRNLEQFFHTYEDSGNQAIKNLSEEIGSVPPGVDFEVKNKSDLFQNLHAIWKLKFLNMWRNPYGVHKFLNSFPSIKLAFPEDSYFSECFHQIDSLKKEDVEDRLMKYDLSLQGYQMWLKGLLLLLMPSKREQTLSGQYDTLFDDLAYKWLADRKSLCAIQLHVLSQDFPGRFLLNDRSYFYSRESDDTTQLFNFNLTDRIAMTVGSFDPSELWQNVLQRDPNVGHFPSALIRQSWKEMADKLHFRVIFNDHEEVKHFNECSILQSHSSVFSSQKGVMGAEIQS